jgi:hypothetical protein
MSNRELYTVVGVAAIVFPGLYVLSDLMELAAGHLYTTQLVVTYLAEAAVPFFMLGLHSVQGRRGGWMSLTGAVLYGAAFVGLSATVLYPLVTGDRDPDDVFDAFGTIYDLNAGLALVGGLVFGIAVLRARVFPRWTGLALIGGLLLTALLVAAGFPEGVQTVGTAIRSVAFAGMGAACLAASRVVEGSIDEAIK